MSDTHLGRTGFQKVDPNTGENLRSKMLYDNFLENIQKFIDLKPDFIIHSGDLFDTVKPQNRAFVVAAEALELLTDADIPLYCIAGNHSMTKVKYTSSPFEILEKVVGKSRTSFVYQFKPLTIVGDECDIHLIPNMHHKDEYLTAFNEITPDPNKYNVLVMHGLCTGIKNKRLNTMAEVEIGIEITGDDRYDYVALGHYHNQEAILPHVRYSGSMEYLTYGEIYDEKGAYIIDTQSGAIDPIRNLSITPMIQGRTIHCQEMSPSDITNDILSQIDRWSPGSMAQIILEGIGPEKSAALDHTHINEVAQKLLHLKLKRDDKREKPDAISSSDEIRSINYADEFKNYVATLGLNETEQSAVIRKGHSIINTVLGA